MATLSDCNESNPDGPHIAEGSMMNRKREHKGLPSSFSSNLSRPRVSPPRTTRERGATQGSGGGNNSVKAIVAWLESSSSQQTTLVSASDADSAKSKLPSIRTSSPAPIASQTIQISPDVEEYSLTLLKYRQYFTATPLGRCLDERAEVSQQKTGRADVTEEPSQAEQTVSAIKTETTEGSKSAAISDVAPVDRECTTTPKPEEPSTTQLFKRDSRDVAAFWNEVRSYLWIPDDELNDETNAGPAETQQAERSPPDVQNKATLTQGHPATYTIPPGVKMTPSSKSRSTSRRVAPRQQKNRSRRHPTTTQDAVSEIDAFLAEDGTKSPVKLSEEAASTLTAPIATASFNTGKHNSGETHNTCPSRPQVSQCVSCDSVKPRVAYSSTSRSTSRSSNRPPPPRSTRVVSSSKPRAPEPPIRDGSDEEWNFF